MHRRFSRLLALLALAGALCAPASAAARTVDLAITGVTVIPMDSERALAGQTVLIDKGRIVRVGPAGRPPKARRTVDGTGRFLIPALADMHVHLAEGFGPRGSKQHGSYPEAATQELADELFLYLANGVTLVRNMDGWPLTLELRRRVRAGLIPGPEIITSGPIIHGPGRGALYKSAADSPGDWASSPAEGAAAVTRQLDAGYDFIKIYNAMSPETYDAILATARARGAKVGGHVPFDVGIHRALAAHQDTIEHLRGYDTDPVNPVSDPTTVERFTHWLKVTDAQIAAYAVESAKSGSTNVPTMVVGEGMKTAVAGTPMDAVPHFELATPGLRHFNEQYGFFNKLMMQATLVTLPKVQQMVRALRDADAPIMAGTDTPLFYALPGFALHTELQLYHQLGYTPYQALRVATVAPARYLGREETQGKIGPGYRADLLLLDADPLADIANTQRIAAVIHDGRLLDRAELDRGLAAIAARNRAARQAP